MICLAALCHSVPAPHHLVQSSAVQKQPQLNYETTQDHTTYATRLTPYQHPICNTTLLSILQISFSVTDRTWLLLCLLHDWPETTTSITITIKHVLPESSSGAAARFLNPELQCGGHHGGRKPPICSAFHAIFNHSLMVLHIRSALLYFHLCLILWERVFHDRAT